MGRHRSTLRELGWGASNSPNPWKQGSAKRVVRTLDYSQAEDDAAVDKAADAHGAGAQESTFDDRLHQLQQDGSLLPRTALALSRVPLGSMHLDGPSGLVHD